MKTNILVITLLLFAGLVACSDESPDVVLQGTWIDTESSALQFIEFTSATEGRFGHFSKNVQRYENFTYRFTDNQLALRFTEGDMPETMHTLQFHGADKIEISDLTVIPENPTKTYQRSNIATEKENNTIILGLNDTYFDVAEGYQLRVDSVLNDSRCPTGVECVWQGAVTVRITVISNGNEHHTVDLSTYPTQASSAVINGITFTLVNVTPYPKYNTPVDPSQYRITLTAQR